MPLPAAALLVEFPAPGSEGKSSGPRFRASDSAGPASSQLSPEEREAIFERGKEEGLVMARLTYAARLEEERIAAEERLAEARAAWAEAEGSRLAERLDAAIGLMQADIEASVASVLSPFIEEAARTAAIKDMTGVLAPMLASGDVARLRVSGPEDLLEALRKHLGDSATALAFEVSDGVDVRVAADRTMIETQLAAWLSRVREQVA